MVEKISFFKNFFQDIYPDITCIHRLTRKLLHHSFKLGDFLKYTFRLSEEEVEKLTKIIKIGKNGARKITRAWILLKSHEGLNYEEIMEALKVSKHVILNVRKNYCEAGLDSALSEKPRPGQPRKTTSDVEAKITALACETPPKGRNYWTIDLIKSELEKEFCVSIGWTSIQKVLKAHNLKPWKKKCGAFQSLMTPTLGA